MANLFFDLPFEFQDPQPTVFLEDPFDEVDTNDQHIFQRWPRGDG